jgi:hypothetical protein
MALIFMDSFGHYKNLTSPDGKWTSSNGNCGIVNQAQGQGQMQIQAGAFGPSKQFGANYTNVLAQTNVNAYGGFGGVQWLLWFYDVAQDIIGIGVDANGEVYAVLHPNQFNSANILGHSSPGVFTFLTFVSVACRALIDAVNGEIQVWINGILVINVTGINTVLAGNANITGIELMSTGGITYHRSVYVLDCATAPHITYLGPGPVIAVVPFANGAPVEWTPLSGQNFSEVNEIPPDGDTSYVSSATPGQVDQYQYANGAPAGATVVGIQHCLDMEIDSGARSVGSDLAGVAGAGIALGVGYNIYTFPYDTNPATLAPFAPADFPLSAGPVVTG